MSFFITSENPGQGANFGGLAGADAHCSALAEAAGATGRTWRAYLSTSTENARDRIGSGPWHNAAGELIANSVDHLHGPENPINKQTGLDETGNEVNGRGDSPNRHDILTGSLPDGTAAEQTCNDWTSGGHGGPPRPYRARRIGRGEVVERVASLARLQPRGAARNRRRRATLLFRGGLNDSAHAPTLRRGCASPQGSTRRGARPSPIGPKDTRPARKVSGASIVSGWPESPARNSSPLSSMRAVVSP